MAYVIVNTYAGGTREQYEAAVGAVHPADGGLPAGQTHHYAGPSQDGWVVVATWDSEDSWNTFRDEVLMPGLGSLGDEGFGAPPEMIAFEAAVDRDS